MAFLEDIKIRFVKQNKNMTMGMRMYGNRPLTDEEINVVKVEIKRIQADENVFIFNDPDHLDRTCYISQEDKIYIGCA